MASSVHSGSSSHHVASLYVGDLHPAVLELTLMQKFSPFGPISSTRVCRDRHTWQSLGYGYINFVNTADAEHAMNILMFDLLMGRPMRIMWAQRDLGTILSCKVVCDEYGSKGFGFVHYDTYEAAERAIHKLNGMMLNDQQVSICHYKTFKERQAGKSTQKDIKSRFPGVSLYVNNLPYSWTDQQLYGLFSPFGLITSAKVMMKNGRSRGFGFVKFESPEAADKAIAVMNGCIIANRCLNVALSQPKDQDVKEIGDTSEAPRDPQRVSPATWGLDDLPDFPQAHSSDDQQPDNQLALIVSSGCQEAEGLLSQCESLRPLISPVLLETVSSVLPCMLVSPAVLDYKEELPRLNPVQPTDAPERSVTCSAVSPLHGHESSQLGRGLVCMGNVSSFKMIVIMDAAASRVLICCFAEDTSMTVIVINHQDVLHQSDRLLLLAQNMAEFMSGQTAASLLERSTSEDRSSRLLEIEDVQPEYDEEEPGTILTPAPSTKRPVFSLLKQTLVSLHMDDFNCD